MISSRVGSPSGFSMTTSQCSKSQPSSNMVSLGGRLDQLGLGSLREEEVARVDRARREGVVGRRRRQREGLAATDMRRRKERAEREEGGGKVRERERKGVRVRVLGKTRERI